jgi:3-methyladenine DNA glycosylase/8-oxoguanine DNA glycosylase
LAYDLSTMAGELTWNKEEAVALLCAKDDKLARLIEHTGVCRLEPRVEHSIFYSLLRAIVYQQLAGKAAAAILARVDALFPGHDYVLPEDIVNAPEELLRSAGLSRTKAAAVRDLAAKTLDGTVPTLSQTQEMTDQQIIQQLVQIRGIGVWSAEMLLIFRLGRADVLPLDDYGVRKGFQVTFGTRQLPTKKQLLRRGERWRPYRSVASWYLWRAAESAPQRRKAVKKKAKPERKRTTVRSHKNKKKTRSTAPKRKRQSPGTGPR